MELNYLRLTSVSRIEAAIKTSGLGKEAATKAIVPYLRKAVAHPQMPLLNSYKIYLWAINHCSMADSVSIFEAVRNGRAAADFQSEVEANKGKFIYPYASTSFTESISSNLCKKPIKWYRDIFEVTETTPDGFNVFLWDVLKNPKAAVPLKDKYRTVDFVHPVATKFYGYDYRVYGYRAQKKVEPKPYIHSHEGDTYRPEISDVDCTVYNTHRANSGDQMTSMLEDMVHPAKKYFYKYDDDNVYRKRIGIRFAASNDRVMDRLYYDANEEAAKLLKNMPEDIVNESLTVSESLPNKGVYICPICGHKVTAWDYNCPVCKCPNARCIRAKWDLESYEHTTEDTETGEEIDTVCSVSYEQDYSSLDNIGGEDIIDIVEAKHDATYRVVTFTKPRLVKKGER